MNFFDCLFWPAFFWKWFFSNITRWILAIWFPFQKPSMEYLLGSWGVPLRIFNGKHWLAVYFKRKNLWFRFFPKLFVSKSIGWIVAIRCLIWILISRFAFEHLCFPFGSTVQTIKCKFFFKEKFTSCFGLLVDTLSHLRCKWMRSAAFLLC